MNNITSKKEKVNIETIKNDKIVKQTTMGTETWTKTKKGILKIWHKNHFYFRM